MHSPSLRSHHRPLPRFLAHPSPCLDLSSIGLPILSTREGRGGSSLASLPIGSALSGSMTLARSRSLGGISLIIAEDENGSTHPEATHRLCEHALPSIIPRSDSINQSWRSVFIPLVPSEISRIVGSLSGAVRITSGRPRWGPTTYGR